MSVETHHVPLTGFTTDPLTISATPGAISTAVVSPNRLGTWLCDGARSEKRPEGRLYLHWHDGRHALGRWTDFQPPDRLAWRWQIEGDSYETTVSFSLSPRGNGTSVEIAVEGLPSQAVDDARAEWTDALQALRLYVETGLNARYLRRPLLGINYTLVTKDVAESRGLEIADGVLIDAVASDSTAAAAGLVAGDLLAEIGGFPLTDWHSLAACLENFRAGDTVEVRFWRDHQVWRLPLTFGGRHPVELPMDGLGIAALARETTGRLVRELRQALDGITEAEARFESAASEWSVKKQLVDLSLTLRGVHEDMARFAADESLLEYADKAFYVRQPFLAALPVRKLEARVVADLRESEAEVVHILAGDPPPTVRRWVAESLRSTAGHVDEHVERIGRVLNDARTARP